MKLTELTDMMDSAEPGALARMEQAWQWLCEQRSTAPDEADVWDTLRQRTSAGPAWLSGLLCRIMASRYRLSPVMLVGKGDGRKAVWGAQDALVLKWVALSLQSLLPQHPACEHVKGHGGGKASVHKLHGLLTGAAEKKTADGAGPQAGATGDEVKGRRPDIRGYRWVCRTDIRGYYRNINKQTLLNQVRQHVQSPVLRDLVAQYVHYTVEDGGTFHTPETGISRGCPLSPLMGALHLYEMDAHFAAQKHIYYARYMDDVIILAKSRWQLRRHVKRLMQWFRAEGFEAHPDKTQIGRTEKGFDWMGAWLTHEGVTDIAPRAKANHREKVRRLYELLARVPLWRRKRARQQVNARVSTYRKRWTIWAGALLALAARAYGDAPIVVIASGNQPGDTGAYIPFGGTLSVSVPIGTRAACAGGRRTIALTTRPAGPIRPSTDEGGVHWTSAQGGGLTPLAGVNAGRLVLVPWGSSTIHNDHFPGTSTIIWGGGSGGSGARAGVVSCENTIGAGESGLRLECNLTDNWYPDYVLSSCLRTSTSGANAATEDLVEGTWTIHTTGGWRIYADQPLLPQSIPPMAAWAQYFSAIAPYDGSSPLAKPSAVVVSGLNCNVESAHGTTIDMGSISYNPNDGAGRMLATKPVELSLTCGGSNSDDGPVNVGVRVTASGGTTVDSNGFLRSTDGGPYLTLNEEAASCSVSAATEPGTKGVGFTEYGPGASGRDTVVHLQAALCSADVVPTPGTYTIHVTAMVVSM
ncbi:TPA: reverse transcriptase domain-containing protein [Serratia marcescens]